MTVFLTQKSQQLLILDQTQNPVLIPNGHQYWSQTQMTPFDHQHRCGSSFHMTLDLTLTLTDIVVIVVTRSLNSGDAADQDHKDFYCCKEYDQRQHIWHVCHNDFLSFWFFCSEKKFLRKILIFWLTVL